MRKIAIGIVIAVVAWIPLSFAEPRDIPFGAAILGMFGTLVGAIVALVVQLIRRGSAPPPT